MPPSQAQKIGEMSADIRAIAKRQDEIAADMKALVNTPEKIDRLNERLEKIEPVAAEFSRWRERGIGALMLISFISAILGAVLTAAWRKIVATVGG